MPEKHWSDVVITMANADIARAKDAMRGQLLRPVHRQPPIRQQVTQAIANPAAMNPDARGGLFQQLYAKYGEQARNVLPYLGGGEEALTTGVP